MDFQSLALALFGRFLASFLYVLRRLNMLDSAAVDSSSILEHREELRDLWEKRMMADDQSSSTSATKPEADTEESVVPATKDAIPQPDACTPSKSEDNPHKLSNGFLKTSECNGVTNDAIVTSQIKEAEPVPTGVDADLENNNSADSLDEDEDDGPPPVSKSEVKQHAEEVSSQVKVTDDTVESSNVEKEQIKNDESVKIESSAKSELPTTSASPAPVVAASTPTLDAASEKEGTESSDEVPQAEEEHAEADGQQKKVDSEVVVPPVTSSTETMEVQVNIGEEAALVGEDNQPPDEDTEVNSVAAEAVCEELLWEEVDSGGKPEEEAETGPEKNVIEKLVEDVQKQQAAQPADEKSRMEALVNGGLKRVLGGVQKTEQPYSTCTTETKIAMEIREMREREEELRVMRERALVSPLPPKSTPSPVARTPSPALKEITVPGPGYRVSSVFGHKGSSPSPPPATDDDKKPPPRPFSKESAVEKEIRLARDREEELRKQNGLPPREDDSYVKPSQVKSSQVRVFGKLNQSPKQAATAKIQLEIEEQTIREMALRETGNIQTISQERTDAKVAKLKELNINIPELNHANGNGEYYSYSNGNSSPDSAYTKRSSPSPTGPRSLPVVSNGKGISMQKFIASRGRETTFAPPPLAKVNGVIKAEEIRSVVPPTTVKLKRNLSVESKIQQEIVEMKQREEELRKLHLNRSNDSYSLDNTNEIELVLNQNNLVEDYENGYNEEDISPRHNKLIAQWEQRIQKAES